MFSALLFRRKRKRLKYNDDVNINRGIQKYSRIITRYTETTHVSTEHSHVDIHVHSCLNIYISHSRMLKESEPLQAF